MSVIHDEGWDGVTAPSLPTGWTYDAHFGATSTTEFTSSPNSLLFTPSGGATTSSYATWTTTDGAGGNVVVQANFHAFAIATHGSWGLTARGSASTLNNSSTNFYHCVLDPVNLELNINKMASGTETNLFSLAINGNVTSGIWYQVIFALNNSSLSAAVQRLSDNNWLNSGGNWQASQALAVSITDSTYSGSGYSGLTVISSSTGSLVYTDDWILSSIAPQTPLPSVLVVPVPFAFWPANRF